MSKFWLNFPGDVAMFSRCCQFEILTVPGNHRRDSHFVVYHRMSSTSEGYVVIPQKIPNLKRTSEFRDFY